MGFGAPTRRASASSTSLSLVGCLAQNPCPVILGTLYSRYIILKMIRTLISNTMILNYGGYEYHIFPFNLYRLY